MNERGKVGLRSRERDTVIIELREELVVIEVLPKEIYIRAQ